MFKVNDLLKAAKGRLISGSKDAVFEGVSIDSRTIRPQEVFIAIKGNNFDGHAFTEEAVKRGAGCIIRSQSQCASLPEGDKVSAQASPKGTKSQVKSSPVVLIEVADTTKALGDIAQFQRKRFNVPVITITGSSGKTTVKEMVAWVLSKNFRVLKNEGTKNNHIGLPMALLNLDDSYDMGVLEAGSNHPGEIEYLARIALPNISVITNIGPAHLEHFKSLEGVLKEKYTLIKYLQKPYIAVFNTDDRLLKRQAAAIKNRPFVFGFGIKAKSDFIASDIKLLGTALEFFVNQKYKFTLKTLGRHNIYNALAAIAIARLSGMEYPDIAAQLADFNFPASRLRLIELNSIRFIDDTYNSNPASLKQALEALNNFAVRGRKIFVMGDMLELGDAQESLHRKIGEDIAGSCDMLITVGRLSRCAAQQAKISGLSAKNIFTCDSNLEARDILFKKIFLSYDDIVLVKGSRAMKMEEVFKS